MFLTGNVKGWFVKGYRKACIEYNKLFKHLKVIPVSKFHNLDPEEYYWRYAEWEMEKAREFNRKFASHLDIKDKAILDLGCGFGGQSIYMALNGAKKVYGVDVDPRRVEFSRKLAEKYRISDRVTFLLSTDKTLPLQDEILDIIIMNDVFEHLIYPKEMLEECHRVLKRNSQIFISFGPPWYHPYGFHMRSIFPGPWTHLLFPERIIVGIRNDIERNGTGNKYEDIGLAKMSVRKFRKLIYQSKFKVVYFDIHMIRNIDPLKYVPLINELFCNEVRCILKKR